MSNQFLNVVQSEQPKPTTVYTFIRFLKDNMAYDAFVNNMNFNLICHSNPLVALPFTNIPNATLTMMYLDHSKLKIKRCLLDSFVWMKSKEGYKFWAQLDDLWQTHF